MLRDLVKEVHQEAENSPFAQLLMSGNISNNQYANYLYQQEAVYTALERRADELGLLNDIQSIRRAKRITLDFVNIAQEQYNLFDSIKQYCTYVKSINQQQCWAHIYVRHFGDRYGGNMIRKLIPGQGKMYEFKDKGKLITYVRSKLSDDMHYEAKLVFRYAIDLFKELESVYDLG